MMKKYALLAAIFLAVSILSIEIQARPYKRYDESTQTCRIIGEGPLEWESRPWGEGGRLFKQVCQKCHSHNSTSGAPFLWVESKTSKGWNRVFAKKYPKCAQDGSWDVLTREQRLRVNDYLFRWAANSQDITDNC